MARSGCHPVRHCPPSAPRSTSSEAVEAARQVLDIEPHSISELLRLEEIFLSAEAYADAVKVMNLRAESIEDPGARAEVLFAVAQLFEEKMG